MGSVVGKSVPNTPAFTSPLIYSLISTTRHVVCTAKEAQLIASIGVVSPVDNGKNNSSSSHISTGSSSSSSSSSSSMSGDIRSRDSRRAVKEDGPDDDEGEVAENDKTGKEAEEELNRISRKEEGDKGGWGGGRRRLGRRRAPAFAMGMTQVAPIQKILDQIELHHLGMIAPVHPHLQPPTSRPSEIHYLCLLEEEDFHVGVFVLPPEARIPLHDHPGMCVLSRLLSGSLNVKDFDWCEPPSSSPSPSPSPSSSSFLRARGYARLTSSLWLEEPTTLSLFDTRNNLHEFHAGKEGCAILDVLIPPYDPMRGRPCNYYQVLDEGAPERGRRRRREGKGATKAGGREGLKVGKVYRLLPTEAPEDFDVVSATYVGPSPLQETLELPPVKGKEGGAGGPKEGKKEGEEEGDQGDDGREHDKEGTR